MGDYKYDGGPAFPASASQSGMYLRDYFAAKAIPIAAEKLKMGLKEYELTQLFGDRAGITGQEIIAALSYEIADAMIARRRGR